MSHTSPASYLVWSVISGLFICFLVFHLWSFDRFRCLRWNTGPYSGAFKRIMTYSYLATMPLIISYAFGFCIIKYREGFVDIPFIGIVAKPYFLWEESSRRAIFPLMLMFSVGWSLEMVTHLEELCFWLFLINSGSGQQDWFHSLYFKTWVVGSTASVIYMPLVTIFTRSDPLKSEAYMFLAGSIGSLSLTLWFTPVLWTFPSFLENLRREGVDINTIVRLTKFHELNTIRVIFRFLFVCPFIILGVDGVTPHTHINESMLWTDFLTVVAAFGCAVSSGITLVIFFPRSIEGEIAAKDARKLTRSNASAFQTRHSDYSQSIIESQPAYLLTSSPVKHAFNFPNHEAGFNSHGSPPDFSPYPTSKSWDDHGEDDKLPPLRPNRRVGNDIELGGIDRLTEDNVSKHNVSNRNNSSSSVARLRPPVNPFIHNFTSPIDLVYTGGSAEILENSSRLTFNRRR